MQKFSYERHTMSEETIKEMLGGGKVMDHGATKLNLS